MSIVSGKTYSILDRLAHPFHSEEAGELLLQFADLFGLRLEEAEGDEYDVQRSHYIETARNEGTQGYTAEAAQRGDLDKIFALYLEALGGTGPLVATSPRVNPRSLDARALAARFAQGEEPLIEWLLSRSASELMRTFVAGDPTARQTVNQLFPTQELRNSLSTSGLNGSQAIRNQLSLLFAGYDVTNLLVGESELTPAFALALLLGQTDVGVYVRGKLSLATRTLLGAYDGGAIVAPRLRTALTADLNNILLRDPGLFRRNQAFFKLESLSSAATALVRSIYLEDLQAQYNAEPNPVRRSQLSATLSDVGPAPQPAGNDQVRLNRLLLAVAFPTVFATPDIRSLDDVSSILSAIVNVLLDIPDLYRADLFPDLTEDYEALRKRYKDDRLWVNRTLLESAFPDEIEKSYAPYRDRLRGLIEVLRTGASTRQGIINIVAANLGITGEDPQTRLARDSITIEEYNPQRVSFFQGGLKLFQEFTVTNSNPGNASPEIWITSSDLPFGLANLRFVDKTSGLAVQTKASMKPGDSLIFRRGSVLLNSVTLQELPTGAIPVLLPGSNTWRFEADLVAEGATRQAGRWDQAAFDVAAFAPDTPVANVDVLSYGYTPGVFTVIIPWHIPGFTDKFEETEDHPRNQISDLVNKVRAAGVNAHVAYRQDFAEDHDHWAALKLRVEGRILAENQSLTDFLRTSTIERSREDQGLGDSLVLSAQFDATYFDSLNMFAG